MSFSRAALIHGHFYQPPREHPNHDVVLYEPSAAPWHDWNDRIADECYDANTRAPIIETQSNGSFVVLQEINNYEYLSFNVGPTLTSWLEAHRPATLKAMQDADSKHHGAIAQTYSHSILPLANRRDLDTEIVWGLADFRHRFGREPAGIWLPEAAVNDVVLRALANHGVRGVILARYQIAGVKPLVGNSNQTENSNEDDDIHSGEYLSDTDSLTGADDSWRSINEFGDAAQVVRWVDPYRPDLWVDIIPYDPNLSQSIAFGAAHLSSEDLCQHLINVASERSMAAVAVDGETFGHHQKFSDRMLAYAFSQLGDKLGLSFTTVEAARRDFVPQLQAKVYESSWSCAHGIGRWSRDCGCKLDTQRASQQRWRTPLRHGIDLIRDFASYEFERAGADNFKAPWVARDAYGQVLVGAMAYSDYADHYLQPYADADKARKLLEIQRRSLAMYTSCGWFFDDISGAEARQVLRYAKHVLVSLNKIGVDTNAVQEEFEQVMQGAESNEPDITNGLEVWNQVSSEYFAEISH